MEFEELFRKRMFLLVLISFGIFFLFVSNESETFGINKTVGWQYDITNWLPFVKSIAILGFLFGYGLLMIFRKETNRNLSIVHLIIIWILGIWDSFFATSLLGTFIFYTASILVFLMNVGWAMRNTKTKDTMNNQ
jgi:cation transport ATPase